MTDPSRPGAGPSNSRSRLPVPLDYGSRWNLIRAGLVFEIKLFVDGLKDILLAPLAAIGVALDLVAGRGSEGRFLGWVMLLGERYEKWVNLYGGPDAGSGDILGAGGSDVLMDRLEDAARHLHGEARERHRKRKERSSTDE